MNLTGSVRFTINSGAALVIYAIGFFGICLVSKWVSAVASNIIGVLGAWTFGYGGFWLKRHGENKNDLEAAKAGLMNNDPNSRFTSAPGMQTPGGVCTPGVNP